MTRTTKWTVHEKKSQPKWFTHHGPGNTDPTKVKKEGAGNHNWGKPGDELNTDDFNFFGKSGRRNSNHDINEEKLRKETERCEKTIL